MGDDTNELRGGLSAHDREAVRNFLRSLTTASYSSKQPRDTFVHAAGALFFAAARVLGIDDARDIFLKYGTPPSQRKINAAENDALLDGYDDMPGKQSKYAYAQQIAKELGISEDSALTRLKRMIKEREERDGVRHQWLRRDLEVLRCAMKASAELGIHPEAAHARLEERVRQCKTLQDYGLLWDWRYNQLLKELQAELEAMRAEIKAR